MIGGAAADRSVRSIVGSAGPVVISQLFQQDLECVSILIVSVVALWRYNLALVVGFWTSVLDQNYW